MKSSRDQELFNLQNDFGLVAALEESFACTIHHGLLNDDPTLALKELSYEYPWIKLITSPATYRNVCDTLVNKGVALGPGFVLTNNLRDKFGFSGVKDVAGSQIFRGFSDNSSRPGLLCQRTTDLSYPRGNENTVTPTGQKLRLPKGSFFVDADIFDDLMLGQSFLAILP